MPLSRNTPPHAFLLVLGLLLGAHPALAKKNPAWDPVSPQELKDDQPKVESDVPAEAIFWRLEINDKGPDWGAPKRLSEYVRYKIYEPNKVESITRVSSLINTLVDFNDAKDIEIRARLTLPDGTVKEFGKDSMAERTVVKGVGSTSVFGETFNTKSWDMKENFLAITGIQPGAVLEFYIATDYGSGELKGRVLQMEGIPIRELSYIYRAQQTSKYGYSAFVFNTGMCRTEFNDDKKESTVTFTAHNVPSLVTEPYSGTQLDIALNIFSGFTKREPRFYSRSYKNHYEQYDTATMGPWSEVSVPYFVSINDYSDPTKRVKKLAASLTQGMSDPLEKAHAIDRDVRTKYLNYLKLPLNKRNGQFMAESLNDALDCEMVGNERGVGGIDFLCLALSMYREAGLEAYAIALPDRQLMRFNPKTVSSVFMEGICIGILIDGKWHFSCYEDYGSLMPNRVPHFGVLPFGFLPWYNEGQVGLVAKPGKEEFIKIPIRPPEESMTVTKAKWQLRAEGDLEGECRMRSTGHDAFSIRTLLLDEPQQKQQDIITKRLAGVMKGAEVSITKVTGLDDAEAPLEIVFKVKWPAYATLVNGRMLLRPSVLNSSASSPFSASKRKFPVVFNYPKADIDLMTIEVPEGFEPENLTSPAPIQMGKAASFMTTYSFDSPRRLLTVRREFVRRAFIFPTKEYSNLKTWFEKVTDTDQQEIIFVSKPASAAIPAASAASSSTGGGAGVP